MADPFTTLKYLFGGISGTEGVRQYFGGADPAQTSFGAPDLELRNMLETNEFGRTLTDYERAHVNQVTHNFVQTAPGTEFKLIKGRWFKKVDNVWSETERPE